MGAFVSPSRPPPSSRRVSPLCKMMLGSQGCAEELVFAWQWGGLALIGAAMVSCHHQRITHAARRVGGVTQVTTGAGDGC